MFMITGAKNELHIVCNGKTYARERTTTCAAAQGDVRLELHKRIRRKQKTLKKRRLGLEQCSAIRKSKKKGHQTSWQDFARNKYVYLMVIPVLVFYILFKYGPMTKMIIAFQDYNLYKGIAGSKWVGLENFIDFFQMKDCWRLLRNTLLLSLYSIVFAFPAPILLALMINEIKSRAGRKLVQTVSYMPHFISLVVVCGILRNFCASTGIINQIIQFVNPSWASPNLLGVPEYYRTIHISSSIWQECGWDSIIYLATLSTIDPQLYEAAYIDGASKLKRILHITLPSLMPVITIS